MTLLSVSGQYVNEAADFDDPYNPVQTVISRFDNTLAKAEEVYTMLVGASGDGGYLGAMQEAIGSAPAVSIVAPNVDTSIILETSGQAVPIFDPGGLQAFPSETYPAPSLGALPSVDTDFSAIAEPVAPPLSLVWAEGELPDALFTALSARLTTDLTSGATGLDPTVEAAIYQRARTRQQADRLAAWEQINTTAQESQFAFPSGVLASALTDYGIAANRMDADIENNIIVTQAELAQKNSQFSIQQANALEQLIRQTHSDKSGRALDYAKALAAEAREYFAEEVRAYVALWEGRKVKVQAQVETLRGVIESNKGLIDIFKAQYDALKTRVEAVAANNKGQTDVFLGQVQGFSEVERAVSARNDSTVKLLAEKIKNADMTLRAAIAEAEQSIAGYTSEMSIKERTSSDIATIAAQVVASMLSAVHAGASIGYNGSESSSKNFSLGASISESHNIEHDPVS